MLYVIGTNEFDYIKIEFQSILGMFSSRTATQKNVKKIIFDLPSSHCTFFENKLDAQFILNEINKNASEIEKESALFDEIPSINTLKIFQLTATEI